MNYRISNSLFESIVNVTNPQVQEAEVDKAHFCATHVEHAMLGLGTCISEQHAEPDEQGQIAWYTVEFPTGTHRIQTSNLRVVEGKSHSHSKKMAESEQIDELSVNTLNRVHSAAVRDANDATRDGDEEKANKRYDLAGKASNKAELKNRAAGLKPSGQHSMEEELDEKKLHPNQQVLDVHEPEKDELTSKDFEMLRAGKKQKAVKEASMGHAGTVTMKQVDKSNATPQVKAAIKKSAPDIKSYADRAAALTAAGIKREAVEDLEEVKMADLPSRKIQGRSYGASKAEPSAFDILKGPRDKDLKSIATKKKPVSAGKALKPKAIKEGISQTIINYDNFRIDVTDNPTYGDYLRALQTMVESRDESIQQEVVAIATAAYDEKIDSIIVESKARQLFAGKLDELRKSGAKVLDESYIVESDSTYVEYTVEKDGVRTQYVHIGTNGNK